MLVTFLVISVCSNNYHGFTILVPVLILPVFLQLLLRNGKISNNTLFWNERLQACRQQMTTGKVFHKHFNHLEYFIFSNWYHTSTELFINNQVIILQACFADFLSAMIAPYWKAMYQEHVSRRLMARTCLFGASWWKFIKALLLYEIVHVSFFFVVVFFDRRNSNSECPRQCPVTRIGIWLARITILTQCHVISNHYKSSERFQGRSTS